jgi:hypothetical protein
MIMHTVDAEEPHIGQPVRAQNAQGCQPVHACDALDAPERSSPRCLSTSLALCLCTAHHHATS